VNDQIKILADTKISAISVLAETIPILKLIPKLIPKEKKKTFSILNGFNLALH
jgi:hypothetical protein